MRRSVARVGHRRPLPEVEVSQDGEVRDAPLVSVIVATFNRSNVLRIALESIREQTLSDWEVLVIGDCCTDDTREVVESLRDPRIRFLNLPSNLGDQSGPNSVGARLARGRYLAWLNHDDLWFPDHLETLVRELEEAGADLAVAPCFRVFELSDRSFPLAGTVQASEARWPLRMARGDVFLASGWLMRRQLAARLGDWNPAGSLRYASSQQYFYRAWSAGALIVLGSQRSVVVMPSIAHEGAYVTRRQSEHVIAARLVHAGDRAAFLPLVVPGSEVLLSPVLELPVAARRRGPFRRWIIRHRERVFRLTGPLAVRLGAAPWEYAGLLIGFPRGGLSALLKEGRGLSSPESPESPESPQSPESSQENVN